MRRDLSPVSLPKNLQGEQLPSLGLMAQGLMFVVLFTVTQEDHVCTHSHRCTHSPTSHTCHTPTEEHAGSLLPAFV